jgi:hypothetical protein
VVMRLALMSMFAACAWAQLKFDIRTEVGRAPDRLKETQRVLRVAEQCAWRDAKAPEERAVVEALAKVYRVHFLPEISPEPKIATLTEKGVDILVARWIGTGAYSELIAWDTPETTSFIFKLPTRSWPSDSAIRATFETLLPIPRPDGGQTRAMGVKLTMARDALTHNWIGTGGLLIGYAPRQWDLGFMNWIDLWETAASSYLCTTFNMFAAPGYPLTMRSIPERFPPLESRVTNWSKKRILEELSRDPEPKDHPRTARFAWERDDMRDRVLTRELLKRDPTDEEMLGALRRRTTDNGAVVQAIVDAKLVGRYSNAIREYLRRDVLIWGKSPGAHGFDIVRPVTDVDFTDVALDVLREHPRAVAARTYAVAHGASVPVVP